MAEWGDEVWQDDEEVRVLHGELSETWKSFDDCTGPWKFPAGLMSYLQEQGFRCPTPIQTYAWPVLCKGADCIGVAKTGSGKTLGYLLPGYIKVKRHEAQERSYDRGPGMLLLAPTRELCQQIYEESEKFGKPADVVTACVYGGAPQQPQLQALRYKPQCVAATPGRLNDFLKRGMLDLELCDYLVLDEADRMLDMGFEPQIKETAQWLPSDRQTALFTATWPSEVQDLAWSLTKDPVHIQVGTTDAQTANADIRQHIVTVHSEQDKITFLEEKFFKMLQEKEGSGLIFTKTKKTAAWLYDTLGKNGAPIVCLHGDMDQTQRDWSLKNFKEGKARVLVATDVAQRGLDIRNVQIVVNYDAPANIQDYVHRIGRTGRAGEKGDSYTCLFASDWHLASQIIKVFKKTGQEVPKDLTDIAEGNAGYGGSSTLDGTWGGKYGDSAWDDSKSWDNKYPESTSYESYETDSQEKGAQEEAQSGEATGYTNHW